MVETIDEKLQNYIFHRKLILDLLQSLNNNDLLSGPPNQAAGIMGKQFRHLFDIERSYIESIIDGKLVFKRTDIDHSIEGSRNGLIAVLKDADDFLIRAIRSLPPGRENQNYIDCAEAEKYFGKEENYTSPLRILSRLIEHEIFHEGQLALYFRLIKKPFPESWMNWGLK